MPRSPRLDSEHIRHPDMRRSARRRSILRRWDGTRFRGRFKNRLVEDDADWRHLFSCIHPNPVRAHLVGREGVSVLLRSRDSDS